MASAEHLLISKVLSDGSLSEAIAQGVQAVHFSVPNQPIWSWMLEFWQKHGSVPTQRVMQDEHPSVTVGDSSGETLSRLVDEVIEGHRSTTVTGMMTESQGWEHRRGDTSPVIGSTGCFRSNITVQGRGSD